MPDPTQLCSGPGCELQHCTPESDLSARIKALAEMEVLGEPYCPGHEAEGGSVACDGCERGRIVLFKGLRVECTVFEFDGALLHVAAQHAHSPHGCPGYVSEPDVEKACWRILEEHPEILDGMQLSSHPILKERVVSAAEAWAQA